MRIAVLGPLEVRADGGPVDLRGARLRALLVRLALDAGRPVGVDSLTDALWGDDPPATTANSLQSLVSRLRSALRPYAGDSELVPSGPAGYSLAVDPADVDTLRFERLVRDGRTAFRAGDHLRAAELLDQAEALWRGPALADLTEAPFATVAAARLDALRQDASDDRAESYLSTGRADEVAAELPARLSEHPLRERGHELLIRALYATGRQADALAVYEGLRGRLADELGIDPSARLRDLHVTILRGEAADPPSTAATDPAVGRQQGGENPVRVATNLRTRLTSFVGRDEDVAAVGDLLDRYRLVTLVGPGGAGKTRLATEIGLSRLAAGPGDRDGLWMVELAPLGDPADVAPAVLATLGASEVVEDLRRPGQVPTARAAKDRLAEVLAGRETTLLLDNCEHLIATVAELAESLTGSCPGLRVLTTSREPLGVPGEQLYPVGSLGLPPEEFAAAEEYPAIRLLADRAQAVRRDFRITAGNSAAVVEICRHLDGMPLAIELAAARLRSLSPEQVADRLSDRFRLLTSGSRTAMPRHQTLRAVVEWSWDLLTDDERAVARRLSVFAGGATLDAAERVCGQPGGLDVLDLLSSLVDKSLVETGESRYRMLETVKEFSAGQLAASGETDAVRRAHLEYFAGLAAQAGPELRAAPQLEWIGRLDADHDNLLGALRYAIEIRRADTAVGLAAVLGEYWNLRGRPAEGLVLSAAALELPGGTPTTQRRMAWLMYAIGLMTTEGNAEYADAEEHGVVPERAAPPGDRRPELAELPWYMRRGLRALARVRILARQVDPRDHDVSVFFANSIWAMIRRDQTSALTELEAAYDDPDLWKASLARMSHAMLAENDGDVSRMEADLTAALRGFRTIGDRWGMSLALRGLGSYRAQVGDYQGALEALTEALDRLTELGSHDGVPFMLAQLAQVRAELGDLDGAEEALDRSAEIARRMASPGTEAMIVGGRSHLARLRGDLDGARRLGEQALSMMDSVAERLAPQGVAMTTANLARVAFAQRRPDDAIELTRRAMDLALVTDDMPVLAGVTELYAEQARATGDPARAALLLGIAAGLRGIRAVGDTDVRRTAELTREALGAPAYEASLEKGAALSRAEAMNELKV